MEQAGIIRNHQQRAQGKSKNSSQAAAAAGTAAKAGAVFLGLVASCHGLKVECLLAFLLAQVKEEKVFFPFSLSLSFHILYIYTRIFLSAFILVVVYTTYLQSSKFFLFSSQSIYLSSCSSATVGCCFLACFSASGLCTTATTSAPLWCYRSTTTTTTSFFVA